MLRIWHPHDVWLRTEILHMMPKSMKQCMPVVVYIGLSVAIINGMYQISQWRKMADLVERRRVH